MSREMHALRDVRVWKRDETTWKTLRSPLITLMLPARAFCFLVLVCRYYRDTRCVRANKCESVCGGQFDMPESHSAESVCGGGREVPVISGCTHMH